MTRISTAASGYSFDDYGQLMKLCLMYGGNVNEVDEKHGTLLHTLMEHSGYSKSGDRPYNVTSYFLKKGKLNNSLLLVVKVLLNWDHLQYHNII